jgi:hypothetical protein
VQGIWLVFRSKITGNLDETGVEAEVSGQYTDILSDQIGFAKIAGRKIELLRVA